MNKEEPNLSSLFFTIRRKSMKNLLFAFVVIFFSSCGKHTIEASYDIVPLPQQVQEAIGEGFLLDTDVVINYTQENDKIKNIAEFLNAYIKEHVGYSLIYQNTEADRQIILSINTELQQPEGYKIKINEHSITIEGGSEAGLFYGLQTLRKTIPVSKNNTNIIFKSVEIEDYPRFSYRGMMLDVSRHFYQVDFIKRYIDILALHNINKLHLHLTEDQGWRIEIKKYPKLTEIGSTRKETIKGFITGEYDNTPHGGYYTQEELKNLVQYAQERYIEIIPEIDLPGHMLAALASYPELGCTGGPYEVATKWGIHSDVLCAGNEQTYEFLENVLLEVFEIFPSEYIHIGGDECPKKRWKECAKCQTKINELKLRDDDKYSKESKLQSYLTHRLEKFITSKGRKLIGWDEIIEGGLAPNATVMSWRGEEGAKFAAQSGRDVIMCPNSHLYFDYYQTENTTNEPAAYPEINSIDEVYNFNPIPQGLSEEETKRIVGVQANLWVEQISKESHAEYMTLPRMAALAELQWTNANRKNYHNFLDRLQKLTFIYDQQQYNFALAPFEPKGEILEDKTGNTLKLKLSTYDNATIYYTLDGSKPTSKDKQYTEPVLLEGSGKVQASAYRNNKLIDGNLFEQDYNVNKATLKNVELQTSVSKYFNPPKGASLLTDGRRGDDCHVFGNPTSWIGFGAKMDVIVDLESVQDIKAVTTSVLLVPNSKGAKYSVSVSEDGINYTSERVEQLSFNAKDDLKINFNNTRGRYVRIIILSDNQTHVLSDEIIIE